MGLKNIFGNMKESNVLDSWLHYMHSRFQRWLVNFVFNLRLQWLPSARKLIMNGHSYLPLKFYLLLTKLIACVVASMPRFAESVSDRL